MADLTRVRGPLEVAAESLDPVIRTLAIRRIEIGREAASLDVFFAAYIEGQKRYAEVPKAETKAPSKSDALTEHVKAILVERGPLDIAALYDAYRMRVPEDTTRTQEALRVALTKRKLAVDRVSETDRRYWPVGVPLNGAYAAIS
jgi:hypothetical protein